MIGVVLTGHGQFAPGLADSMGLIIGEQENFAVVPFTPELAPEELSQRLLDAVREAGRDETLILCDLAGGTPFNDRDDVTVAELASQLQETGRSSLSRFVLPSFDEDDLDE